MDWHPMTPYIPGILCLSIDGWEVARVQQRVDGQGWVSQVARHRRASERRLHVVVRSERAAKRYAERWVQANIERIRRELPTSKRGPAGICVYEYPASNPER